MSATWPNEPATGGTVKIDHNFSTILAAGMTNQYNSGQLITDATAPISPASVYKSWISPGAIYGGTQLNWSDGGLYTSLYCGVMWRTNSQFQGRTALDKMFFLRGPDSNGCFGIMGGPTKGGSPYIIFCHNSGNVDNSHTMAGDLGLVGYPNKSSGIIVHGQWTKVEGYIKPSTTLTSRDGIVRWWINGVLAGEYTNINYGPSGLNEWVWTETWDGCGGNPNCDLGRVNTVEWAHHLDHLYLVSGGTGSGGSGGGGGGGGGGTPAILPAPTGLYPNGVTLPYGPTTFQWNAVPGAAEYKLRVHVGGMPYDPPTPPNYLVVEDLSATSRQLTTSPSSTYDWWIHSENSAGDFGPSNGASFSTTASSVPPPPNPDPPPDPPPPPPVDPPVDPPPPVVVPPPVDPTDPTTLPPDPLPTPQVLGTATVIVTIKDRQNPIKKEFHFYG